VELPPPPPKPALIEAMARFSFAVAGYARALTVGLRDTDEEGLARFLRAVAPIDALRIVGKPTDDEVDDLDDEDGEEEDEKPSDPDEDPSPSPDGPFVT
jgi:hypothetical protein